MHSNINKKAKKIQQQNKPLLMYEHGTMLVCIKIKDVGLSVHDNNDKKICHVFYYYSK